MLEHVTDGDLDLLDELGVQTAAAEAEELSAKEQRVIAGFEEIERFVKQHGRPPEHDESRDIFERLFAARLDRIRDSAECREVLKGRDSLGLLDAGDQALEDARLDKASDEELLESLGIETPPGDDVSDMVNVRSREEIKAADEIAERRACHDFAQFQPIFEKIRGELKSGRRQTVKYGDHAAIERGALFILDGQTVLVADAGEEFISDYGRPDRRLRVVYDNGTESDLLLRSLQRALYKDPNSRRITRPGFGLLFSDDEEENDLATGHIYVLRSKSEHPFVAEHREVLHKIGVTGGDVKNRVAGAAKDPTYLLADVELVATYKLANVNRSALEALLHKFFGAARLDLQLKDRFGSHVEPQEWFLVPLAAIDEAIERIKDGTIGDFRYDPAAARLAPAL